MSKVSKVFRPGCCGRGFGLRWFERLHWRAGGCVCFWVCEGVDMDGLGSSQAEGFVISLASREVQLLVVATRHGADAAGATSCLLCIEHRRWGCLVML